MKKNVLLRVCIFCFAFFATCQQVKAEDSLGSLFIDNIRYVLVEHAERGLEWWIDLVYPFEFSHPELSGDIVIPDSIEVLQNGIAYPVRFINGGYEWFGGGHSFFYKQPGITSIRLPEPLVDIEEFAFYECTGITEIRIPDSVEYIGGYAFAQTGITKMSLPSKVKLVEYGGIDEGGILEGCHINNLIIEDGEETLATLEQDPPETDLFGCEIDTLYLGRNIGYGLLPRGIKEITIGKCFNQEQELWFKSDHGSMELITEMVKFQCDTIKRWFQYATREEEEKNHEDLNFIELVKNVEICDGVKVIGGGAFQQAYTMTSVDLPGSIVSLEPECFSECYSLQSISIPNGVTNIGRGAFYDCTSLTEVNLPASLLSLGTDAFNGCDSLNSVFCKAMVPPVMGSQNCFTCYDKAILYVPRMSVNAYQESNWWNCFSEIIGMDFDDEPIDPNGDGRIAIDDVTMLIDCLLSGAGDEYIPSLDVDRNGKVNIADVTALIDILLRGH
jgi:hypothetical protein